MKQPAHVPKRFIPDGRQIIGEPGCEKVDCDNPAPQNRMPQLCRECWIDGFTDGLAGCDCPECGEEAVNMETDAGTQRFCIECMWNAENLAPTTTDLW